MANLSLATPILPQRITPGSQFELPFHVHESGQNFNWSGYTPKARIDVTTSYTNSIVTGTVTNQAGGTALITLTRAFTLDWDTFVGSFGEMTLFAESASTKRVIAVIPFQVAAKVIT